MPAQTPSPITEHDRTAAYARMSAVLDRAAESTGVSPEEFRAAIRESMQYADARMKNPGCYDLSPEAFVLSLVGQLF